MTFRIEKPIRRLDALAPGDRVLVRTVLGVDPGEASRCANSIGVVVDQDADGVRVKFSHGKTWWVYACECEVA